MSNILGEQIQKFRKKLGLTQKELGQSIGVSTQAVSQWECGGTPDVLLLPAIADRLGVTVDALFGREGGEVQNFYDIARKWMKTIPGEKQIDQICHLVWEMVKASDGAAKLSVPDIGYMKNAVGDKMITSVISNQNGLIFGVSGEDISFMSIWPEAEAGYAKYFSDVAKYQELFGILAKSGCLEMLEYLASVKHSFYAPEVVARAVGTEADEILEILEELVKLEVMERLEVGLETGEVNLYAMKEPWVLAPFLYMARCFMDTGYNYLALNMREAPWLKSSEVKEDSK